VSERYQKTFISAREFVESWDKELYELTYLDYFIYQMINYLGNRLEKHYFIRDKKHSSLFLDFDDLGTVCFNLGDSFEFFLEENCLGTCPLNCPRDLDTVVKIDRQQLEDRVKKKLALLQSIILGDLDKEQCLRIDLLNHVILDTLLQFYLDEFELEIKEDDIALLDLAEFIENVIIDFIRFEGYALLEKPSETAMYYFEEMLENEADDQQSKEWSQNEATWEPPKDQSDWNDVSDTIDDVFLRFISDQHYNPSNYSDALVHDINYFNRYLKEEAQIKKISDLREYHLGEFFSIWLVREFVLGDEKQITYIFRAVARFITFLYHHYNINLKRDFLRYYDKLKLDLPRVIKATNTFIYEYNLLETLLFDEDVVTEHRIGLFKINEILDNSTRLIEVQDIKIPAQKEIFRLNSTTLNKLQPGDIIHTRLCKKNGAWEISEIQFIYPKLAARLI